MNTTHTTSQSILYPSTIKFNQPPCGIVTIQKGQFGYERKTRIRLAKDIKSIYFETKHSKIYREDPNNSSIYYLAN